MLNIASMSLSYRTLLLLYLLLQCCSVPSVFAEGGNDMDSMDGGGDTGDSGDTMDYGEGSRAGGQEYPRGQGFGHESPQLHVNDKVKPTTPSPGGHLKPKGPPPTPKPQTFMEMTIKAILQLGMIVGVAILCGSLFMGMVWMEMLMDNLAERYRKFFDKPEPIPDIERLHPAELVGTFARYK